VWREETQVQGVSSLERGKEDASSREGSACGHATRGVAKRIEEKSGACLMTKGTGAVRAHSERRQSHCNVVKQES